MSDPRCQLVADALRRFGSVQLRVWGCSMAPSIPPGSVVRVATHPFDQVAAGQLVMFLRGSRLYVHRSVGPSVDSDGPCLITRGDSLDECDAPVRPSEFLGCVMAVRPAPWLAFWRTARALLAPLQRFLLARS